MASDASAALTQVGQEPPQAPNWELARQWSLAWRALKWGVGGLIALALLMVVGQGYLYYNLFADIHPLLGIGFVAVLTAALGLLVGRPLWGFFRTPVMAQPPHVSTDESDPGSAAMRTRLAYDLRYLAALRRNPHLRGEAEAIESSIQAGRRLADAARAGDLENRRALLARIHAFEAEHIEARLAALDARVDQIIRAEAVAVGVATAVSMNGTVDAFIVLWRNANLVSRIARLYFGRPHLRGSLLILRDVAAIVIVSRALEDVTDITGDVIGGLLGRMGGLVAGPVMDGAVNATMTLKLGYLAKRRCRTFEAWTPASARSISAEALERVKRDSGAVVGDLLKRCGGLKASAMRATERALEGSKSTWSIIQSWFGTAAS